MRKLWSKNEVDLLIKLYENDGLSLSEIHPIFNEEYNRTLQSISVKIGKLKLKHSKEQTKNIKIRLNSGELNGMFGKKSPLNGLTKNNSELIKNKSFKISETRKEMFKKGLLPILSGDTNPMYNLKAWNSGLNKNIDERLFNYGKKISIKRKEEWENKSEEEKNKIIIRLSEAMIQTRKPTKIENKIENFLIESKIKYIKNKRFKLFIFDFYLPTNNLVIECDGDYWHANPKFYLNRILTEAQIKNKDRDNRKNLLLKSNNINFIRFWEDDIHNNYEYVINKIKEKINENNF